MLHELLKKVHIWYENNLKVDFHRRIRLIRCTAFPSIESQHESLTRSFALTSSLWIVQVHFGEHFVDSLDANVNVIKVYSVWPVFNWEMLLALPYNKDVESYDKSDNSQNLTFSWSFAPGKYIKRAWRQPNSETKRSTMHYIYLMNSNIYYDISRIWSCFTRLVYMVLIFCTYNCFRSLWYWDRSVFNL